MSIISLQLAPNSGTSGDSQSAPYASDRLNQGRREARDWTYRELSTLKQIQTILDDAGVCLELERGVTDEGDPWLALCTEAGDVFLHVCRIGMIYLLDGPTLEAPVQGPNIEAIVQRFGERTTIWSAAVSGAKASGSLRFKKS